MLKNNTSIRTRAIEMIEILASSQMQLDYEHSLTSAGHAPTELICMYCDDFFHPKSLDFVGEFSEAELKDLAYLYGLVRQSIMFSSATEMLKSVDWRKMMSFAKELKGTFN